jgi:hypothetical protein
VQKARKKKKKHKATKAEGDDDDTENTRAALRLQDPSHYAIVGFACGE